MTRSLMVTLALACSSEGVDDALPDPMSVPALGDGSHQLADVWLDTIATDADGLDVPRDLAFDTDAPGRLWVVNQADDSVTVIDDAGTDAQTTRHIVDPFALHFMEEVSSIAFGAPGRFATCQESRNTYNDRYQANDFMGPTLWSSDLDVFGQTNESAVEHLTDLYGYRVDLGSHLDMQHETPLCVGIAWEADNVYWAFDGQAGSIDRVDFHQDHGAGFDDHSDGETSTWVSGEVARVADVPSHMVYDPDTALLYIADTGNNRVAVLDTLSGEDGRNLPKTEPGTTHYRVDDADIWTLVDGADVGMVAPSGLALHDGVLFVGDHGTGRLWAFDTAGAPIDHLDLEVDGLMGIEVVSTDEIWAVDAAGDTVVRLSPAD